MAQLTEERIAQAKMEIATGHTMFIHAEDSDFSGLLIPECLFTTAMLSEILLTAPTRYVH